MPVWRHIHLLLLKTQYQTIFTFKVEIQHASLTTYTPIITENPIPKNFHIWRWNTTCQFDDIYTYYYWKPNTKQFSHLKVKYNMPVWRHIHLLLLKTQYQTIFTFKVEIQHASLTTYTSIITENPIPNNFHIWRWNTTCQFDDIYTYYYWKPNTKQFSHLKLKYNMPVWRHIHLLLLKTQYQTIFTFEGEIQHASLTTYTPIITENPIPNNFHIWRWNTTCQFDDIYTYYYWQPNTKQFSHLKVKYNMPILRYMQLLLLTTQYQTIFI